jgi:NodT family efflux transporter outer membrane factor (OMF) lipoprotein
MLPAAKVMVLAALLGGCAAVGPNYVEPRVDLPPAWSRAPEGAERFSRSERETLAQWWRELGDDTLCALIQQALAGSNELHIAQARLREARARRLFTGAALFPTVTASAAVSRGRSSGETGFGKSKTSQLFSAGFDASWEPDVFGGTRRAIEAAQADLESSEASLHHTQVSLVAEVALNYVEVRAFQARLAIARSNLQSQSETLQLTEWRMEAGLASSLDVEQARANREQTRAQIPVLETGVAEAQHRIAVLVGQPPGALSAILAPPAPIPPVPERIATGIPADTLRQRPDVRAAERKVAAETARIGQAVAARYPSLTLTGSIGLEALSVAALGAGDALTHALLASVGGVIFDAGRLRQQVEIQSAIQEQALVAYQAAVLTALEDVENALVSLAMSRERETALHAATEAARNAALLARDRYTSGLIDFQTLLNTERTVLTLEDSLAATQAEGVSALIQLYKALGGGWSSEPSQR